MAEWEKFGHLLMAMEKLIKRNKNILQFGCFLLGVCILCVVVMWNDRVRITFYDINNSPCKIVLLTDIHNRSVDTTVIKQEKPDLIAVSGDIINSDCTDLSIATTLLERLALIAPTYVSLGNHELEYEERTGEDIAAIFEETGAIVLDKKYVDVEINNKSVRVGGIYGYCLPERYNHDNEDEIDFLREFEDTDSYTILLNHLPYSWTHYGISEDYDIDLVLSGHTHGGQIILPFVGGLYDPEFGFFPGKVSGRFDSNDTTVIVSNGIGSANEILPRLNKPEIVVIISDGL